MPKVAKTYRLQKARIVSFKTRCMPMRTFSLKKRGKMHNKRAPTVATKTQLNLVQLGSPEPRSLAPCLREFLFNFVGGDGSIGSYTTQTTERKCSAKSII